MVAVDNRELEGRFANHCALMPLLTASFQPATFVERASKQQNAILGEMKEWLNASTSEKFGAFGFGLPIDHDGGGSTSPSLLGSQRIGWAFNGFATVSVFAVLAVFAGAALVLFHAYCACWCCSVLARTQLGKCAAAEW